MSRQQESRAADSGEALDFLAAHSQVYLLARLADGRPTGYPMVGRLAGGGIEFSTYRKSAKVAKVLRRERASCLVVPRDGSSERRTLWVCGPVSLRDEQGANVSVAQGAAVTGTSTPPGIAVPAAIRDKVRARHDSGKRCVLRIEVEQARFALAARQAGGERVSSQGDGRPDSARSDGSRCSSAGSSSARPNSACSSSARPNIAMSPDEIDVFLGQRAAVVVVADDPELPAPIAGVAAAAYGNGVIEFELPADDPVALALASDPRTCCIAEQAPSYYEIKAVIVRGVAEPLSAAGPGNVRFRVQVGEPTSFDFGRLPEAGAGGGAS